MGKFVVLLVIASAAIAQVAGFVKGGYSDTNPSTSVTFVNRGIPAGVPNTIASSAGPTVSLNVNGAHTLAGEVILHHVLYNGNGAPIVNSAGLPVGSGAFNRGLTQVIQLHGNGRTQNQGTLTIPSGSAEFFTQYLTPNGFHESRPNVHISPPGPVYQYDTERRLPGMNSETVYQQPIIYSQQTLKPTTLQNQQIIQTRPQISQQVQRNPQITQQLNHHHQQHQQQQQQQQQRDSQSHIHRISQLQQRPATSISGQQITQQHQQNGRVTFLPGTRKPNELTVIETSDGGRGGRLPGMPTLSEITSQLSGMSSQNTKAV